MALSKTTVVSGIRVYIDTGDSSKKVKVNYFHTIDDPNDALLPLTSYTNKTFVQGDDTSGETQLVRDICAAVWS
jgi:uncharacterized surface anchored protein